MEKGPFDDFVKFNLVNVLEYRPNAIVVLNILVQDTCVIQGMAFDFGKALPYEKSPYSRYIYIIEGKAEVVINDNSTFLQKGDSILIPSCTPSSIEANHKFKMLCATIKNE